MTLTDRAALAMADAALDELLSRGGFPGWWDELNDSRQTEVRWALARRIRGAIVSFPEPEPDCDCMDRR